MENIKTNRIFVLVICLLFVIGCSAPSKAKSSQPTETKVSAENNLIVYFFDVGQGDSILIRTPSKADILIDGGNNDQGERLVHYLKELQVDHLEAIVATHPDADHIGGLDNVLDSFKVNTVYAPKVSHNTKTFEDFLKAVKKQGIKIQSAKEGVIIPLQDAAARFVGAVKEDYEDMNDYSAVLRLTYGQTSFLFTGDAPESSEKEMIAAGENLKADVLKVGHHGASTSSSPEFLKAVGAKFGIISVGKDNKYHHPTDKTLNNLKKANVQVFRTDQSGTIEAISDGKQVTIKTER